MVISRSGCLCAASTAFLFLHGTPAAQDPQREAGQPQQRAAAGAYPLLRIGDAESVRKALLKAHPAAVAAIEQGLHWLAGHQEKDGRWDADDFMAHDKDERTDGAGRAVYDVAVTGLALLAFAREGAAPKGDSRQALILRAAHWLAAQQQANGVIGGNQTSDFIYGHSISTLALWAATAATGSTEARTAAEKGCEYLAQHRNPYGVWRYQPRDGDNDTSVTTWALLAMLAAHEQGHDKHPEALRAAAVWMDAITDPKTGHAGYTKVGEPSSRKVGTMQMFPPEHGEAMTAAALLCRMGLGQTATTPITTAAANRLVAKPAQWEPDGGKVDHCYWFFASEALRHFGGTEQQQWATQLEAALVKGQRVDKAFAGSWDPVDPWGSDGGRIYATALSVLALQGLAPFERPAANKPKTK